MSFDYFLPLTLVPSPDNQVLKLKNLKVWIPELEFYRSSGTLLGIYSFRNLHVYLLSDGFSFLVSFCLAQLIQGHINFEILYFWLHIGTGVLVYRCS